MTTLRPMKIGILGGTGPAGSALALRLASVGYDVIIGSRSTERAAEVVERLLADWPGHDLPLHPGDNATAAGAEMVVVSTPWEAAASTAASVAERLSGKVVVCMCNALTKVGREFLPLVPPRGSVSAGVQAEVRAAYVAAALHHVPAKELGQIDEPVESDVLVCSDHPLAIEAVSEVLDRIPDLRPLDAGALSNATAIEAFTAVLLQLNVRYRTRVAVRFTGIPEDPPGRG